MVAQLRREAEATAELIPGALEALEALAPEPAGPPRAAIDALVGTARIWAPVTPRPALIALADSLPA